MHLRMRLIGDPGNELGHGYVENPDNGKRIPGKWILKWKSNPVTRVATVELDLEIRDEDVHTLYAQDPVQDSDELQHTGNNPTGSGDGSTIRALCLQGDLGKIDRG